MQPAVLFGTAEPGTWPVVLTAADQLGGQGDARAEGVIFEHLAGPGVDRQHRIRLGPGGKGQRDAQGLRWGSDLQEGALPCASGGHY